MLCRLLALLALLATSATAQDSDLEALSTLDAARGWEAVGRLDIDGKGFCTASLIAEDLVLTAAHCLFDSATGEAIAPERMEFLAGLRDGRALAYRGVRQAVAHPDYLLAAGTTMENVVRDLALLRLDRPIRTTQITPFATGLEPGPGAAVGVVSYASDRAEAPSLQEMCTVLGRQQAVLVMSCEVDFGSSGAPVFHLDGGRARIVSVVSAKAEIESGRVSLGMALDDPLARLRAELDTGGGSFTGVTGSSIRMIRPGEDTGGETGARFLRP